MNWVIDIKVSADLGTLNIHLPRPTLLHAPACKFFLGISEVLVMLAPMGPRAKDYDSSLAVLREGLRAGFVCVLTIESVDRVPFRGSFQD